MLLAGVVVLGLLPAGLAVAEPSGSPTPMSPTPASSLSPTPTITPTPIATPSSSESARKAKKADLLEVRFEGGCSGSPMRVRVNADFDQFGGRDLDWVLHGPGGSVDSGRVVWIDDEDGADPYYDDLEFTLDPGHYRVAVALAEDSQVVVDAEFDVVECVTVENGCHTVTFTNPAVNPAMLVRYSAAQTGDWPDQDPAKPREAIIQPGESRAVEIFWFEISWDAYAPADAPDDLWPNAGGTTASCRCSIADRR